MRHTGQAAAVVVALVMLALWLGLGQALELVLDAADGPEELLRFR